MEVSQSSSLWTSQRCTFQLREPNQLTLIPGSNKSKACSQLTSKNPGEQTRSKQGATCIKLLDRNFSRSHTRAFRQTVGAHATGTTDCGPRQIARTGKKTAVPLPEKQEGTPWRPGRCSETRLPPGSYHETPRRSGDWGGVRRSEAPGSTAGSGFQTEKWEEAL